MNRANKTGNHLTGRSELQGEVIQSFIINEVNKQTGKKEYQMRIIILSDGRTYLKNIMCAWEAGRKYIKTCGELGLIDSDWEVHPEWLIGRTVEFTLKKWNGKLYADEICYPRDTCGAEEGTDGFVEVDDFSEIEGFDTGIA